MSPVSIITEYNPFHNGHKAQIDKIKKEFSDSPVICVMSGNFVQRGEPAIFDKYLRTKSALMNGADLVLELPLFYAASSAEYFAIGATKILDSTGIVKTLCFGSESGDIRSLSAIAAALIDKEEEINNHIKNISKSGLSYPKARQEALSVVLPGYENIIKEPNNILGIEYLKAIKKQNLHLEAFTSLREGEHYHSNDFESGLASASGLRKAIFGGLWKDSLQNIPENIRGLYEKAIDENDFRKVGDFSLILRYSVFNQGKNKLRGILDIDEGLENLIFSACERNYSIEEILSFIKSKRYTRTRLSRALLHILLDITKKDFEEFGQNGGPQYIRVLGFRKESVYLLKQMKEKAKLPVITNLKYAENILSPLGMKMLEKEISASRIYWLLNGGRENNEYKIPLVIV